MLSILCSCSIFDLLCPRGVVECQSAQVVDGLQGWMLGPPSDGLPRCSGKLAHVHRALDCHLHPHAIHPSLSLDFQGRTTSIIQKTAPIYKSTRSFYLVEPVWYPNDLIKDG